MQHYNASLVPEDHASVSNRTVLLPLPKSLEGPLNTKPEYSPFHLKLFVNFQVSPVDKLGTQVTTRERRRQKVRSRIILAQRASRRRLLELAPSSSSMAILQPGAETLRAK